MAQGKYEKVQTNRIMIKSVDTGDTSKHYWDKSLRIKWTITYFIGVLLVYSVRSAMSICTAAIGKDLGWNKHVAGMALSAFFCGYVTTNVLGGYLADKYGGEIVVFYTGLCWSTLTMILPILAQSQSMFFSGTVAVLANRFLTGVTQGAFFPSLTAILTKHVPIAERGFVFGFAYSGSSVGTITTGFVGSIIIEHSGWPSVFILIGLLSLLWVVWMRYLDNTQRTNAIIKEKEQAIFHEPFPWRKLIRCRSVWALFISFFCQAFCFYNVLAWAPVYFHDAFPESKGWVFNVVPWLFAFIIANLSGYFANKLVVGGFSITFIRKLYASLLFLGITLSSLALTSVETFHQALFAMTLNIGVNSFFTCSLSLNAQDLAPKHAGALHGIMNSNGAFAGFVGVYFTGHILETTNNWATVFRSTSLVSLIGFLIFTLFGSGKQLV